MQVNQSTLGNKVSLCPVSSSGSALVCKDLQPGLPDKMIACLSVWSDEHQDGQDAALQLPHQAGKGK